MYSGIIQLNKRIQFKHCTVEDLNVVMKRYFLPVFGAVSKNVKYQITSPPVKHINIFWSECASYFRVRNTP